ncbi:hypothetical protein FVE85_3601 [Porphyridium purpureum]|uniref:Uncharacterized protein n=1 Tax=Porphyridium purpureum TaxID=35688 RepID=A0A5J4YNA7_PORPP|nr:hypothetical protein FVE85_3601 [Porphyridium purpureum]|eukprot:POR3598..scf249_10
MEVLSQARKRRPAGEEEEDNDAERALRHELLEASGAQVEARKKYKRVAEVDVRVDGREHARSVFADVSRIEDAGRDRLDDECLSVAGQCAVPAAGVRNAPDAAGLRVELSKEALHAEAFAGSGVDVQVQSGHRVWRPNQIETNEQAPSAVLLDTARTQEALVSDAVVPREEATNEKFSNAQTHSADACRQRQNEVQFDANSASRPARTRKKSDTKHRLQANQHEEILTNAALKALRAGSQPVAVSIQESWSESNEASESRTQPKTAAALRKRKSRAKLMEMRGIEAMRRQEAEQRRSLRARQGAEGRARAAADKRNRRAQQMAERGAEVVRRDEASRRRAYRARQDAEARAAETVRKRESRAKKVSAFGLDAVRREEALKRQARRLRQVEVHGLEAFRRAQAEQKKAQRARKKEEQTPERPPP